MKLWSQQAYMRFYETTQKSMVYKQEIEIQLGNKKNDRILQGKNGLLSKTGH